MRDSGIRFVEAGHSGAASEQGNAGDEIAEAHHNVSMRLARVIELLDRMKMEPWAGNAVHTLLTRAQEVKQVIDAVLAFCKDSPDWRVEVLLEEDASLAEYLRGLLAWTDGVVRALDVLCAELDAGRPDFRAARHRFDDATSFHLVHLVDAIRARAQALHMEPTSPAYQHLEELFWAASWLETTLTARVNAA